MFQKTSFTTLIVGVFVVYVLHTCWVMYGIVYTKPCENPKFENCINPYLAGKPRLQVGMHHCKLARWNENLPVRQLFWVWKHLLCFFILHSQLSIYTALRPNADGGHTLIHKEEDFDVETKFERCNMSYGDRIWWYLSVSQL